MAAYSGSFVDFDSFADSGSSVDLDSFAGFDSLVCFVAYFEVVVEDHLRHHQDYFDLKSMKSLKLLTHEVMSSVTSHPS